MAFTIPALTRRRGRIKLAICAAACTLAFAVLAKSSSALALRCPPGAVVRVEVNPDVGTTARWCERDGARDGVYTVSHPDGTRLLTVRFRRGTRHGPMTRWHPNGTMATAGAFEHGTPDGVWVHWGQDGQRLGHYTLRSGTGPVRRWWENGALRSTGALERGERSGAWTFYRRDSTVQRTGGYRAGKPHGVWSEFAATGAPMGTYVLDHGDGLVVRWYANGERREHGRLSGGQREGLWLRWHDNGLSASTTRWHRGRRHGELRRWHRNGQLAERALWRDGKRNGRSVQWGYDGVMAAETSWQSGARHGIELRFGADSVDRIACHDRGVLVWERVGANLSAAKARSLVCVHRAVTAALP